ncbi:MAG: CoA pyrophosphatase [Trueperaceae bacterium]
MTAPSGPQTDPRLLAERLAAATPRKLQIDGFRRASVLVPLLYGPDGVEVLFTVRAARLKSHAGEIAFPGGRLDPGETHVEAALRETEEEVGLSVTPDQVLGRLSDHPSPAGYVATPYVAQVPWPQELTLNPGEVDAVFTVPLAELLAIEPQTRVAELARYRRLLYSYPWGEYLIWGFTGNVVRDLLEVIAGDPTGPNDPFDPRDP